jgi:hypothetical protein
MKINLEKDEVFDVLEIVGDVYSELLLQHQLQKKGQDHPSFNTPDENIERLFTCANIMVKINRQAHDEGLCACKDDADITLQEQIFHKMFKKRIETNAWWKEQVGEHGGFPVASPPSPTSSHKIQQGSSTEQSEQDKPLESDAGPKKKRQ